MRKILTSCVDVAFAINAYPDNKYRRIDVDYKSPYHPNKIHTSRCIGKIFPAEFQRFPLKFESILAIHWKRCALYYIEIKSSSIKEVYHPVSYWKHISCQVNLHDVAKHDDIIKWKHFLRYWPFVGEIHRSPVNSRTKASDAGLWCFLWSAPE